MYISWLLRMLRNEINYGGPDVIEILVVLKSCVNSDIALQRTRLAIWLYENFKGETTKKFILLISQLLDNTEHEDRLKDKLELVERDVLAMIFMDMYMRGWLENQD